MFFFRSTIDIDGFSMVFPNSGAMVSDGFDLEKALKMTKFEINPDLRFSPFLPSPQSYHIKKFPAVINR